MTIQGFQSTRDAVHYLAGMFDGEGTVSGPTAWRDYSHRRVSIANTDTVLLEACGEALQMLDIEYGYYDRTHTRPDHWKACADVVIYGRDNIQRFFDLVPFRSPEKRLKMRELLNSYQYLRRRRRDFPLEELVRLYNEGWTYTQLATHFGCSKATVFRWGQIAGLKARPRGVPKKGGGCVATQR